MNSGLCFTERRIGQLLILSSCADVWVGDKKVCGMLLDSFTNYTQDPQGQRQTEIVGVVSRSSS